MQKIRNSNLVLPLVLLIFSLFSGYFINRATNFIQYENQLSKLAQAFINNDLFLNPLGLPLGDYAEYKSRQYVFYGPMPSILLIPAVLLFGQDFPQTFLSFISLIVIYMCIFLISKLFVKSISDCLMLANFFVFGTVLYFLGLVPITAYTMQVIGLAFIVAAIYFYFVKRNWLIIGALIAAAGLTRLIYLGAIVFFVIELFRTNRQTVWKSFLLLTIPFLISLFILGIYNFRRFGSVFETGYKYNITLKSYPLDANLKKGLLSIKHIPANLYLLLLKGPEAVKSKDHGFNLVFPYLKADGWGMAIWFTSPLFLYLIKYKKVAYSYSAIATIILLSFPSLLYFGIGFSQYGYRYSLDFLPFLFLILLPTFKDGLTTFAKFLIFIGILFNCFYMLSLWDKYPLFELFGFK